MLAKIAVTLATGVGLGMLAGNALGASLAVQVAPGTVHPGTRYTITVSGRYDVRSRGTVFLLAFIQYNGAACKATGTAEYRLPSSEWDWALSTPRRPSPQRQETSSPFREVVGWTAGSRLGSRRVCAYLYAKRVTPASTAAPIARASTSYRNTKKS